VEDLRFGSGESGTYKVMLSSEWLEAQREEPVVGTLGAVCAVSPDGACQRMARCGMYLSGKDDSAEAWAKAHPPGFALAFNFQPQQSILFKKLRERGSGRSQRYIHVRVCKTAWGGFDYLCQYGVAGRLPLFSPVTSIHSSSPAKSLLNLVPIIILTPSSHEFLSETTAGCALTWPFNPLAQSLLRWVALQGSPQYYHQ
jgi:hypothetical protein